MINYSQPLEVSNLTSWLDAALRSSLPDFWVLLIESVLVILVLLIAYAVIALILIYAERKITAFFQARYGPNRVGKWGLLQSVADMIKILLKEIIKINRSDRFLFFAAPFFMIIASMLTFGATHSWRSASFDLFSIPVIGTISVA